MACLGRWAGKLQCSSLGFQSWHTFLACGTVQQRYCVGRANQLSSHSLPVNLKLNQIVEQGKGKKKVRLFNLAIEYFIFHIN